MILGIKKLHELVASDKLAENLCEREMNNPEGAGFDLRLGEVYELLEEKDGFLGIEERKTPESKLVAKFDETAPETFFTFETGKYYLVKTVEKVNLPLNLTALIYPRTTLFRSGLALFNGQVAPGYCGELTFGLSNLGKSNMKVALGSRVVHVMFHEVLGEGNEYRGQWKGGRVSTGEKEVQI